MKNELLQVRISSGNDFVIINDVLIGTELEVANFTLKRILSEYNFGGNYSHVTVESAIIGECYQEIGKIEKVF